MGLGSMIFMVPHFTAEPNLMTAANNSSSDNICRGVSLREQDMGLGKRALIYTWKIRFSLADN